MAYYSKHQVKNVYVNFTKTDHLFNGACNVAIKQMVSRNISKVKGPINVTCK